MLKSLSDSVFSIVKLLGIFEDLAGIHFLGIDVLDKFDFAECPVTKISYDS